MDIATIPVDRHCGFVGTRTAVEQGEASQHITGQSSVSTHCRCTERSIMGDNWGHSPQCCNAGTKFCCESSLPLNGGSEALIFCPYVLLGRLQNGDI